LILATARQHTCATKDDNRRADDPSAKPLFHLGIFQLQADAAHGIAKKKIAIEHGEAECIGVFLRGIIVYVHSGAPAKTPDLRADLSKMAAAIIVALFRICDASFGNMYNTSIITG
jgi:hypothetical protein